MSPEHNPGLWAPWRMEYIRSMSDDADEHGCFLCHYWQHPNRDDDHHVVCRREGCFAVLNRFPYTNGHLLVACRRHVGDVNELSPEEWSDMGELTRDMVRALEHTVMAQGFNVGLNLGRCAGAGLPEHLHIHVVPRWNGDTNYMSVVGDVRIINDALDKVHAQLRALFQKG